MKLRSAYLSKNYGFADDMALSLIQFYSFNVPLFDQFMVTPGF